MQANGRNSNMAFVCCFVILFPVLIAVGIAFPVRAAPTTLVQIPVTNTQDSGAGSLRQALLDANSYARSSVKMIYFNIPTTDPGFDGKVFTIKPLSEYPIILDNVVVDGNTQTLFTGETNVDGPEIVLNGSFSSQSAALRISGDDNVVNALVISGFAGGGIDISYYPDGTPSRNKITGNYIGTDPTGTIAAPNGIAIGIHGYASITSQASSNEIQDNILSASVGAGVSLCDAADTLVRSNLIGAGRHGEVLGNGTQGIAIGCAGAPRNQIFDNVIANNGLDGIEDSPDYRYSEAYMSDGHQGNTFRRNAIYNNAKLGINLFPPPFETNDGVTPNDLGDVDVGGNLLQNYPVLTSIALGAGLTVTGTLDSSPNSVYIVDFYLNDAADLSGNGEGQTYIGTVSVMTDSSGNVSFAETLAVTAHRDQWVTATATDIAGNTSEFSRPIKTTASFGTLNITKSGSGSGVIVSAPGGINCGADCSEAYPVSTAVTLTAAPFAGSDFVNWSGCSSSSGAVCVVTIHQDATVSAAFNARQYAVSVAKTGEGTGSVSSDPAGIHCGGVCSSAFTEGTQITLTATATAGSRFTGWSGACTGRSACVVMIDEAKSLTATFALKRFTLSVTKSGNHSAEITVISDPPGIMCGSKCEQIYQTGSLITLYVDGISTLDWIWVGDCSGAGMCQLVMEGNKQVELQVIDAGYRLNLPEMRK